MCAKVSVIIPVYNVEDYIEESLKSVCEQNYDNLEIILINDGTKDHSIDKAEKIAKKFNAKIMIINKENGGLPSARNVGIKCASGDYVCFIDSDDIIAYNHIADLVAACEKYGTKVSYASFQLTYEKNRRGKPTCENESCLIKHDDLLHDFLVRKVKIHCCALLINREYLLDNDIFFNEKLRYGEDIDFMWRIFPSLESIAYTGNETYMYLQRANSLMTSQNLERVLILLREFEATVEQLMEKYPKDVKILKFLYGKASLAFYRTFAESSKYELFEELLKQSNYRKNVWKVLFIGDVKLAMLSFSLLISPKLFVYIVKKYQETVIVSDCVNDN